MDDNGAGDSESLVTCYRSFEVYGNDSGGTTISDLVSLVRVRLLASLFSLWDDRFQECHEGRAFPLVSIVEVTWCVVALDVVTQLGRIDCLADVSSACEGSAGRSGGGPNRVAVDVFLEGVGWIDMGKVRKVFVF